MDTAQLGLRSTDSNIEETSGLISPPTTKTFSASAAQSTHDLRPVRRATDAEPVDAGALSNALNEYEDSRVRPREYSPGASPSRKRQRKVYGDR